MKTHWQLIDSAAKWPPRDSAGAVVFDEQLWLIGGFTLADGTFRRLRDVWRSADGRRWNRLVAEAPWAARNLAGCVVFEDRLYLMGGFDGVRTLADVWCSTDGMSWECVASHTPWGARGAFGCVVYDGRLWVFGGLEWEGRRHHADVWSSTDGVNWEQVEARASWGERAMFPAVVHDEAMWVLGGGNYHDPTASVSDVWRSSDGVRWERITPEAGWAPRRFHKAVSHGGALWVLGGATVGTINQRDVWMTRTGRDWKCVDDPAPWDVRHEFGLLPAWGRVWLLGGFSGEIAGNIIYNDIWRMEVIS